jgi:nitroimidazol reductase NimA-like FMN-containing flavoprotein (pyridoxamine 5'-phosphate oxidase superfamily)
MASTGEPDVEGARVLETLTVDEIRALLPGHGIGRVVFVDTRGPVALPVNYVRDHDDFVFRTESWSTILAAASADGSASRSTRSTRTRSSAGACSPRAGCIASRTRRTCST